MKKNQIILASLALVLCLTGCLKKTSDTTAPGHVFDPKIPGGVIGSTGVLESVQNLAADTSVQGQVTLTWTVPTLYQPLNYTIKIYKHKGNDASFVLPDPTQNYTSSDLYKLAEVQASSYLDDGSVQTVIDDTDYNYWVYLYLNNQWSSPIQLLVHTKSNTSSFALPSAANFWSKYTWALGQDPTVLGGQTYQSVYTMDAGTAFGNVGSPAGSTPKGRTAFGFNGGLMYVADTDNNRVLVYSRAAILACEQYKSDPETFGACMYAASGTPLQPLNVLGQPSQNSVSACPQGFPHSQCLNHPTGVFVSGNNLLIADSGNNRIVVWNHLPGDPNRHDAGGCDGDIIVNQHQPSDCLPDSQVGTAYLGDTVDYSSDLAHYGDRTLKNPAGIYVNSYTLNSQVYNDLYIADTGNHRVVKIRNYDNVNYFSCNGKTPDTAPTIDFKTNSLCKFQAVLGQPTFFGSTTFNDMVTSDNAHQATCQVVTNQNSCQALTGCQWSLGQTGVGSCSATSVIIDQTGFKNTISQTNQYILRRYFANPSQIKVTTDGKLLVMANENYSATSAIGTPVKLNSRILIFGNNPLNGDTPACIQATFFDAQGGNASSAGCDATDVVGQSDFRTLLSLQTNGNYYDIAYGLEDLQDFDVYGKSMIGVDGKNNFVYLWSDWTSVNGAGHAPTEKALNPNGAADPNNSRFLPALKGISSVSIEPVNQLIYVTDSQGHRVYEIRGY